MPGGTHGTGSVVSQILSEMDGIGKLKNGTIIPTTKQPDVLDNALLPFGRIEWHICVPLRISRGEGKNI